jgi:iron complex transport system ATP-binding protein
MSTAILQTEHLAVGYDGHAVIEQVNIDALRGSMICLLGPNGAGKSTILRTLSGMLSPVHGAVYVESSNIGSITRKTLAQKMAVVLTDKMNPGLLTAIEIVAMGRHPYTGFFGRLKNADRDVVNAALDSVNALPLASRYYNELSDGEKQKILIARALAQEPELIILDEPTSHLDIRHRIEVMTILSRLCKDKGITVILSLHDIDLALKGCETVLMVKDGRIVAQGAPEQIVHQGVVQELYDITHAHYDDLLGSLEFSSSCASSVFVTGGAGSGIPVYRALRRAGYGMDCGVLHQSDVDAHVARALCNSLVLERDFEQITDARYENALTLLRKQKVVIDTGFPVGDINLRNVSLIQEAVKLDSTVLSLRRREEAYMIFGKAAEVMGFFYDTHLLLGWIKENVT